MKPVTNKVLAPILLCVALIISSNSSVFSQTGTWQVLPNSPVAPYYHHDDIHFYDENIGWVCNISGEIWKTEDGGDSWTKVLDQPKSSFRAITFSDDLNGWVGNLGPGSWVTSTQDTSVLYATNDGGITWNNVKNIVGPKPTGVYGMQAVNDTTIYGVGRFGGASFF